MPTIALCLALLVQSPAAPKKPGPADIEKLVTRFFAAPSAERAEILAKLETADPIAPTGVKDWTKRLLTFTAKGPLLGEKGRNFLYDEKAKRGLYLLGGKRGSNAGLFMGLHGGGAGSGDATTSEYLSGPASGHGWAAIFPEVLEKTEAAWGDEPTEKFVLELIEHAKRTLKLDTNRIYLGGHSMGGYGTWTIGARHADLFAGLVATAGAPTPYRDPKDQKTPVGIQDGILPNLRNVPLWVYHSRDDPNVDFATNEFATRELGKMQKASGGYVHHFDAVDGRAHDLPEMGPPIDWISKFARDPRPKKIVWQPFRPWKRMFYWLWWDAPKIGETITVEMTAPNTFEVTGKEPIDGLSILLDEKMAKLDQDVIVRVNGNERVRRKPVRSIATMLLTAAERNDAAMLFVARVKIDGK